MKPHGQFAIIPARALDDTRFDDNPRHLYALAVLGTYADRDGWCYPSLKTIAERLLVSRPTVSTMMHDLEEWGYIHIVHRPGGNGNGNQSNMYRIIYDTELPPEFARENAEHPVKSPRVSPEHPVKSPRVSPEHPVKFSRVGVSNNGPLNGPLNAPGRLPPSADAPLDLDTDSQADSHPNADEASAMERLEQETAVGQASVAGAGVVVEDAPRAQTQADAEFDALPSASVGMKSSGVRTAAVADARVQTEEEAAWVREQCQSILPMAESPSTRKGLERAVRRIVGLGIPRDRLAEYFDYLRNEAGEKLRNDPDASWFWLAARLSGWKARGYPRLYPAATGGGPVITHSTVIL